MIGLSKFVSVDNIVSVRYVVEGVCQKRASGRGRRVFKGTGDDPTETSREIRRGYSSVQGGVCSKMKESERREGANKGYDVQ